MSGPALLVWPSQLMWPPSWASFNPCLSHFSGDITEFWHIKHWLCVAAWTSSLSSGLLRPPCRHCSLAHITCSQWSLKIIVQGSMSTRSILLLAGDLVCLPSITQVVNSVYFDIKNLKNSSLGRCFYEGDLFNCIINSCSLLSNEFLFWWVKYMSGALPLRQLTG